MKKTIMLSLINRLVLVLLIGTVFLSTGCDGDDDDDIPVAPTSTVVTLKTVNLSGKNEVPANASAATGTFSGSYDNSSNVLSYTVIFAGMNPTQMHFHIGYPGISGPIEINLTVPTTSPNTGSVTLNDTQEADFQAGKFYINIHSAAYPAGEIRGQVVTTDLEIFENIEMSGDFEVPVSGSASTGEFNAIYNKSSNIMTYNVTYNVPAPTGFHIHTGEAGVSGPIAVPLTTPTVSPTSGTTTAFTDQQETDLLAGKLYVNLHNATYPDGAIRGQLANENIIVFNNIELKGANEVPANASTSTGTFYGTYNLTTNLLAYNVSYAGFTPTASHIHRGAVGVSGGIEITLATPSSSPSSGTTPAFSAAQETDLLNETLYVNLHSATYPDGEIRGQLVQ